MEWILENWELIALIIMILDKIVAKTPNPYDDIIFTSIKESLNIFKKK